MAIATNSDSNQIKWLQVWSLAAVQGAISLTWIAYAAYLPKFIEQVFAYPASQAQQFAALILVIESAIAVIVEPLFGGLSDRWQRWYSTRMPFIIFGAIASTAIFIGLPSLVIFGGANEITRLILPSLAILWAMVMATFRSPVICLLGIFAGATQLPLAGSVLTLVGGFVSSIRPLASGFILSLGAPITFTIASITLLAAVAGLRSAMLHIPKNLAPDLDEKEPLPIVQSLPSLAIVMLVGAAIGLGLRLLMGEVVPRTVRTEIVSFTGFSFEILMGTAFIAQALFAIFTGRLSKLIDNRRLMMFSLGGLAAGLALLTTGSGAIASILIILWMMTCLSAVNNGMVAFALTMVPKSLGGLSIGTFFGGLSGAIAIFGYLVPKSSEMLSLATAIIFTAICFVVAGIGIGSGRLVK